MTGPQRKRQLWVAVGSAYLLSFCAAAHASVSVPAGGRIALNGGALHLGCTDVQVGGTLALGAGSIDQARDVSFLGQIDAGAGSITLGGIWNNAGSFVAGSSHVSLVDACALAAALIGDTIFSGLSLLSTIGKRFRIPPGDTQTILNLLRIHGTQANPLQIESGVHGSPGFMRLAPGGTQDISHLGVSHNWATGQPLAPGLFNEGGTGNSRGWFGVPLTDLRPIPSLGPFGLTLLTLLVAGLGFVFRAGSTNTISRRLA